MADVEINADSTNTKKLLGQGIKAYIMEDYETSVAALSKVSELLVTEHGDDQHESLGDVYLYYGKALIALSREQTGALGDAVKNKDESEDDEDEEGDEEEAKGADVKDEESADNGASAAAEVNGGTDENEPTGSGTAEASAEKEEEPTDLQLAWEVLELAKKIYTKQGEEGKKNLAETLIALGEVSLESENFELAVNDIKEGLRMQKELFPDDSRAVAETCYKLGVAYSTNSQIDEAVNSFGDALKYLKNRLSALEKKEQKDSEVEEEIQEVKNLIPDVEDKIADMHSYKDEVCRCDIRTSIREFVGKPRFAAVDASEVNRIEVRTKASLEAVLSKAVKQIMNAVKEAKPTSAGDSSSSKTDNKPAADISHLVKRKRKLYEIVEECEKEAEASPAKKPAEDNKPAS
ncbi:hypothetical protein NQ315_001491 [Exocentrus adspersus]|uniref:Tetratricopeptide SHNi-TPR domain-containing protein n=1 Tax=Exocentrus adspersus TaxID=1586481 RepID=A0AAV8W8E6_9CUCU|nr:hypothetical protein NQ315_001491 [Exocentrus adspersus]